MAHLLVIDTPCLGEDGFATGRGFKWMPIVKPGLYALDLCTALNNIISMILTSIKI